MEQVLQFCAFFLLSVLGVVAPFILFLLSIYQEGTSILRTRYESERDVNQKNLADQIKNLKVNDTDVIKESIKKLETASKTAKDKLSSLNPITQAAQLLAPLLLSFVAILIMFLTKDYLWVYWGLALFSVSAFARASYVLFDLFNLLIEVRQAIDNKSNELKNDRSKAEDKMIELLSQLVKKESAGYFLTSVYPALDKNAYKNDSGVISIPVNAKNNFIVSVDNNDPRMVKNVELGFILPLDYIVEKKETTCKSITTSEKEQIVRYEISNIQGKTFQPLGRLVFSSVNKGDYSVTAFIKAENMEASYRKITFKVK